MKHIFSSPTEMIIEKNAVQNNADKICSFGKKAMIITGKNSARITGALSDITSVLDNKKIPYVIFSEIEENPSYKTVKKASLISIDEKCDFFIGIGGGSPLDSAKAISLLSANSEINEEDFYSLNLKNDPYPIICIGTTAGTGSEVTPYSIITGTDGRKKSIGSKKILPVLSLGDINYTAKMPDSVIRSTALDALCHCFESYFNKTSDDFSKTFALKGIKLLIPELETISAYGTEGLDDEDRENIYLASIYAGYAIATTGTAMCHTLSYYLTEKLILPHGFSCAAYLPAFIMHNSKWAPVISSSFHEEICRTEDEMRTLVSDVTGDLNIKLTENNLDEIRPRLTNNKSLQKCFGECNEEYIEQIIRALFV